MAKKNKDNAIKKHRNKASNKDKGKIKSYNLSTANQSQTQAPKKDKQDCQKSYPAISVNAIEVTKKDKNKVKDLHHVKYYTYKLEKGHYANKCPKKSKN